MGQIHVSMLMYTDACICAYYYLILKHMDAYIHRYMYMHILLHTQIHAYIHTNVCTHTFILILERREDPCMD